MNITQKMFLTALFCVPIAHASAQAQVDHDGRISGRILNQRDLENALYKSSTILRKAWMAKHNGMTPVATSEPKIVSGTVDTPTVDVGTPPGVPRLTITSKPDSSGTHAIFIGIKSESTYQFFVWYYTNPYPSLVFTTPLQIQSPAGSYPTSESFTGSLGLYSAPGTWTVYYMYIQDNAGNIVSYQTSQVSTIFKGDPNFTVTNNGSPDTTPPTYTTGKILTKSISVSAGLPFRATINAADDLSGVGFFSLTMTAPDGSYSVSSGSDVAAPYTSINSFLTFAVFPSGVPTGVWTITELELCDIAGNCIIDTNQTDIKAAFGTISVTIKS